MKWNTSGKRTTGSYWEQQAKAFLEKKGLTTLASNYYSRFGEIDLIMKDGNTFVFVEVKYRKSNQFGGAISTISTKKQLNLTKTATIYLQQEQLNAYNTACRFDIVAIDGEQHAPTINWLKNAF